MLMLASLLVMTRYVGPEYGTIMFGWSLIGLVNAVSDLGFDAATVKFISEGKDLNGCISTHLFIKAILMGVMVLITLVYLSVMILAESIDHEKTMIVLAFLAYYVLFGFNWVLIHTFDGRQESTKSAVVQAVETAVRSVMLIILALFSASALILSTGYVVGIVFSIVLAVFLFRGMGYRLSRPKYLKEYVKFAKPIALGLLLITAITYLDKVLVGVYWGDLEVGYYTAAFGIVGAAATLGVALNYVLLPKFSELFSSGDRSAVKSILWKAEKFIALLFVPPVIFMLVFGDSLAPVLFGSDFAPSGIIISVLSLYILFSVIGGILTQVLYSFNNSHLYRNATFVFVASAFILLIVLVPEDIGGLTVAGYGAAGAAVAMTVGYLFFLIFVEYYVRKTTGITLHKGLLRQLLAGLAVFACAFFIRGYGEFGLLPLILLLLLCFGLYTAILLLLREMKKEDLRFILNALSPKKLYENTKDEMKK